MMLVKCENMLYNYIVKGEYMERIKQLGELIENCGHISKLLITSEIAINDGDLSASQKAMVEAQGLVKVMLDDVFKEVVEMFGNKSTELVDYDLPTTLEMTRVMNDAVYNAGVLIDLYLNNSSATIIESVETKITKDINTISEIAQAIFFN